MFRFSEMGWIEETRNGLSFYLVGVTKGGKRGVRCALLCGQCCILQISSDSNVYNDLLSIQAFRAFDQGLFDNILFSFLISKYSLFKV